MFISDSEASERLNSDKNLFIKNPELVPSTPSDGETFESEVPSELNEVSESDSEIQSSESSSLEVEQHQFRGRTIGATGIPPIMRAIIGATAHFDTAKDVAETFNVSPTSVHDFKHGIVRSSETRQVNPELKRKVDSIIEETHEQAAERMMKAIGFISDEKLGAAKAGDLATIAANLSRVIEKTSPKTGANVGVQIIIQAPALKEESSYKVIEA